MDGVKSEMKERKGGKREMGEKIIREIKRKYKNQVTKQKVV